jgi:tetratricopeptide (TPR) repeat protein
MSKIRIVQSIMATLMLASSSMAISSFEASPFEEQVLLAMQRIDSLRATAPVLASALNGNAKSSPIEGQDALSRLQVGQAGIVTLGQAGQAAILESKTSGEGLAQLDLASRMAGNDLGSHWMISLAMIRTGSPIAASRAIQGLETSLLSQGWQRQPQAAAWLIALANESTSRVMADTLRKAASRIDPISPVPTFAIARRCLVRGDFDGLYEMLRMTGLRLWSFPQNQLLVSLNALRLLRSIGLLFSFLLFIGWIAKNWPWVSHQMAERLPQDSSIYLRYGVLAVGFLCILLAGAGAYVFFFLGAFLLWKHLTRIERILMGALILFIGAQGIFATAEEVLARNFDLQSKESLRLRATEEAPSPQLQRMLKEHNDPQALATLYMKAGDLLQAASFQKQLGNDPTGLILSGDLCFVRGMYDSASQFYAKAFALDPQNPVLPFNRGQAASWMGHTDSLNPILNKATLAGAYRFEQAVSQNSRLFSELPPSRQVLPPEQSAPKIWEGIISEVSDPTTWFSGNGSVGGIDIPYLLLPWVALGLLGYLIATSKPRNLARHLFRCKTCGRVMCKHCRRGLHCLSCFRRLSNVSELELRNELLLRLEKEGQQRELFLLNLLDIALPGTGSFSKSPSLVSALKILLLATSVSMLLNLAGVLTRYPFSQASIGQMPFVLILVMLYGTNIALFLRKNKRALVKG